jgi:hypothetical protein
MKEVNIKGVAKKIIVPKNESKLFNISLLSNP